MFTLPFAPVIGTPAGYRLASGAFRADGFIYGS